MALGSIIASGLFWYGERRPYAQLIYGAVLPQSLVIDWGYGAEHGGYTDHELAQYRWIAMGLSIPVLMIVGYLFVTHYGRLRMPSSAAKPGRFRFRTPSLWSRIPIRLPGRLTALVWLELRQSVPLVTFGLLFALLIAIASVLIEPHSQLLRSRGHASYHFICRHAVGRRRRIRPVLGGSRFRTWGLLEIAADLLGHVVLDQVRRRSGGGCGCARWSHDSYLLECSQIFADDRNELGLCRLFPDHSRAHVRIGGSRNVLVSQTGYRCLLGHSWIRCADHRDHDFPDDRPSGTHQRLQRAATVRNAPGTLISPSMVIRSSTAFLRFRLSCSRCSHPDWQDHLSQHSAGSRCWLNDTVISADQPRRLDWKTAEARGSKL